MGQWRRTMILFESRAGNKILVIKSSWLLRHFRDFVLLLSKKCKRDPTTAPTPNLSALSDDISSRARSFLYLIFFFFSFLLLNPITQLIQSRWNLAAVTWRCESRPASRSHCRERDAAGFVSGSRSLFRMLFNYHQHTNLPTLVTS